MVLSHPQRWGSARPGSPSTFRALPSCPQPPPPRRCGSWPGADGHAGGDRPAARGPALPGGHARGGLRGGSSNATRFGSLARTEEAPPAAGGRAGGRRRCLFWGAGSARPGRSSRAWPCSPLRRGPDPDRVAPFAPEVGRVHVLPGPSTGSTARPAWPVQWAKSPSARASWFRSSARSKRVDQSRIGSLHSGRQIAHARPPAPARFHAAGAGQRRGLDADGSPAVGDDDHVLVLDATFEPHDVCTHRAGSGAPVRAGQGGRGRHHGPAPWATGSLPRPVHDPASVTYVQIPARARASASSRAAPCSPRRLDVPGLRRPHSLRGRPRHPALERQRLPARTTSSLPRRPFSPQGRTSGRTRSQASARDEPPRRRPHLHPGSHRRTIPATWRRSLRSGLGPRARSAWTGFGEPSTAPRTRPRRLVRASLQPAGAPGVADLSDDKGSQHRRQRCAVDTAGNAVPAPTGVSDSTPTGTTITVAQTRTAPFLLVSSKSTEASQRTSD